LNKSSVLWRGLYNACVIGPTAAASAAATAIGILDRDASGVVRTCAIGTGAVITPCLKFKSLFEFGDRELFQQTELV